MVNLLLIGAGGFAGAVSRYGVSQLMPPSKLFYGTLAVNLLGCLLIGVAYGCLPKEPTGEPVKLLLVTGFLGGFTTFSTFGLDTIKLVEGGSPATAAWYVGVSVVAGIALAAAGYAITK